MAYLKEPERQPFLRVPAATVGLIVVLFAAHVARVLAPPERSSAILVNYAFYPARYSHAFLVAQHMDPGSLWDRAIPFVTYAFLHGSFTHLGINCVWLLPFGSIVARRFGAILFFAFFIVCAIAGAFVHLLLNWGSPEYVVGASAAIAGMMAASFRIVAPIEATSAADYTSAINAQHALPLAPITSRRVLVWSAVVIAVFTLAGRFGLLAGGPGNQVIAWQAHIGGYLAGLLVAQPFDFMARRLRS